MLDSTHTGLTLKVLNKAFTASVMRQEVISNNIANVDTPNYKKSYVSFEEELRWALKRPKQVLSARKTDPRHIDFGPPIPEADDVQPQIHRQDDTTYRTDGNNIDIDVEANEMAENTIMAGYLAVWMREDYRMLSAAANAR
ncbi:MAG: flagellar basal body rod protein FlgB [bacterium]